MKTFAGRHAACLLLCLFAMVPVAASAAITASVAAGVLNVALSAPADQANISTNGANVEVHSGVTLVTSVATASLTGISVNGNNGLGQSVVFQGTLTLSGAIDVAGVDSVNHSADYTAGSFSYVVRRNIATFMGIHATAGAVVLQANLAGTGTGNFYGISLEGTQVTSADFIVIGAQGGDNGPNNYGVVIFAGAKVQATGTANVNINGTGGGGTPQGIGTIISDAGTEVTSASGSVLVEGHGGTASGDNPGVWLQHNALVSSASGIVVVSGEANNSFGVVMIDGAAVTGTGIVAISDNATDLGLHLEPGTIVSGGSVTYAADRMDLRATTTATGSALIRSAANTVPVLFAATGPAGTLVLDPANLGLITAPQLNIGADTFTGGIEVPTSFPLGGVGELVLLNAGPIAGPGTISVPNLTIRTGGSTPHAWTIDGASAQEDAGTPLGFMGSTLSVRGGTGSDTFNVTPHPSTAISVNGFDPDPPVLPGDRLDMNMAGATGASLSSALTGSGYNGTWTFTNRATVTFAAIESAAARQLTVTAPANAAVGVPFNVTVSAVDDFGVVDTGYTGTVHFTSSDGAAVLPADAMLVNGTGNFPVTLLTPGNQTVTATDTITASVTGTSGAIAVAVGAATHFSVTAPAAAASGSPFGFTVTALDVGNNVVTGYAGTVHFTSTDATATLPADAMLVNGTGNFSATLNANGSFTITATDTVTPAITGTSATVTASLKSFSAPSATGTGIITATFTGGGAGCTFTNPQMIAAPPGAPPVPPTLPGPGYTFTHGMFDFQLTGCDVGSSVTMSITYPSRPGQMWKYGSEVGNPADHWYVMPATYAGNTITYTLTDGGQGDDDLVANGTMVDPVGPAFPTAGVNVPTMSQWMLMLLALMMLGMGIHSRKR